VATAFKLALAEVDTYQLVFYANLTAVIVLIAAVTWAGKLNELSTVFRAHWRLTIISGLLNPVIYYLVLFKAYELLPAQVALSINYSWAIVLSLMAIVFLKQKMIKADLVAAFICYGGVFVIATQGEFTSFASVSIFGVVLALISTVIWASYWTLNIADRRDPVTGLCLNFVIALPVSAIVCLVFSGFYISIRGAAGVVYIGLVEMGIAFLFWSTALRLTSNASRVSNLIFLSPFVSLVIINKVLDEPILPTTLIGLALIIGGLLLQQGMHNRHEKT
jgi:drug/metabolite transporter (DMT)-like permease